VARGSREAKARITGDTAGLDRALGQSRKRFQKWGQGVKRDISNALRGGFDTLKSIAGFGGIAGLVIATRDVLAFETRLTRLGIQAGRSGADMEDLRKRISSLSTATGQSASDILGGAEKFVALTGDFQTANELLDVFAKTATASGASLEDIGEAAAVLRTNFGLAGDEIQHSFDILLAQGKAGAIELKDFAGLIGALSPRFTGFAAKGTDALAEMGAVLEQLRVGFGSSSEAATGFESLMGAIVQNADRFRRVGVNPFERGPKGEKQLRDFSDIVFELLAKSKGDPEILQKVLGRKEAVNAILQLAKGGRAEVEKLIALGKESNAVEKDAATFLDSKAGRIARAQESLKNTINDTIAKHADSIAKAFEAIATAVKFIVDHPVAAALALGAVKFGPGLLGALSGGGGIAGAGGGAVAGGGVATAGGGAGLLSVAPAASFGLAAAGFLDILNTLDEREAQNRDINRTIDLAMDPTGEFHKLKQRSLQGDKTFNAQDDDRLRELARVGNKNQHQLAERGIRLSPVEATFGSGAAAAQAAAAAPAAATPQRIDVVVRVENGNIVAAVENDRDLRRGP